MRARRHHDWLVVGAGLAGAVLAERLAAGLGRRVAIVDRREHVAGNACDERDAAGVLVHRYGPHIFHTNADAVVGYLSRFTAWRPYEHRVLADVGGGSLVPVPINGETIRRLFGLDLDPAGVEAFLAARAEPRSPVRTSEDVVVGRVGRELYELLFRGYTRKQWGVDASQLDASVTARIPVRTDRDDRYFTDRFQAMPAAGYTALVARMLDHSNITVLTGVEASDARRSIRHDRLAWTGPLDEFFEHRLGLLPYRSLEFRFETLAGARLQPVGTINHPSEGVPYTRVTEFGHLTGQWGSQTTLVREFPRSEGEPYYPVPTRESAALADGYRALAAARPDVVFLGRLASYRYYNMDQVVGQALAVSRAIADGVPAPLAA